MPIKRATGEIPEPEHPWHRWPDETDGCWAHFQAFLAMPAGARSYKDLAKARGVAQATLRSYSNAVNNRPTWLQRCRAYDIHVAERLEDIVIQERGEMMLEHRKVWQAVRKVAMTSIQRIRAEGKSLSAEQALRWAEISIKNERLALGEAGEKATFTLEGMEPSGLAAMQAFMDKGPSKAEDGS